MTKYFNMDDFGKCVAVSNSDEFRGNGLIKIPSKKGKRTRQKNHFSLKISKSK